MSDLLLDWIYNSSIWMVTGSFIAAGLVGVAISLAVTYAATSRSTRESHSELTSFTVTNIAVLYSVLLAFIAVATWESFTKATEVVEAEANLTGNMYRDTKGLPKAVADDLQNEIKRYLSVVIEQEWPVQQSGTVPNAGWAPLNQIHSDVASLVPENPGQAVLMQEMLRSLNSLYAARSSRLEAVRGHIPEMVWFVLVGVGALTIGFTCFVRSTGFLVHLAMVGGLTIALTLVISLIVELDYPFRGSISVSTEAYRIVVEGLGEKSF